MEFSKDLVKVSCEAGLYKSHFLSCDSAANTFTLQPHDGNPRASFPPTSSRCNLPGLETILGIPLFFFQPSIHFRLTPSIFLYITSSHSYSTLTLTPPWQNTNNILFLQIFLEHQDVPCPRTPVMAPEMFWYTDQRFLKE